MNADTLVLASPDSLVAAVPHLMGFQPKESIVIVWLQRGRILVTQRCDLHPAITDPAGMAQMVLDKGADEAIVLFVTDLEVIDKDLETDTENFIDWMKNATNLRDAIWVTDGRWGSLMCEDTDCCPPEGRPINDTLVAAEFVGMGSAPLDDRADLEKLCVPAGEPLTSDELPNIRNLERWRDAAITEFMLGYDGASVSLRLVGASLADVRVRDTILWKMTQGTEPQKFSDYIAKVCEAMPPNEDAAPALTVAAIAAWTRGNGALASVIVDRALALQRGYSLGVLVEASLSAGLPPTAWADSMAELTYEQVRVPVKVRG